MRKPEKMMITVLTRLMIAKDFRMNDEPPDEENLLPEYP